MAEQKQQQQQNQQNQGNQQEAKEPKEPKLSEKLTKDQLSIVKNAKESLGGDKAKELAEQYVMLNENRSAIDVFENSDQDIPVPQVLIDEDNRLKKSIGKQLHDVAVDNVNELLPDGLQEKVFKVMELYGQDKLNILITADRTDDSFKIAGSRKAPKSGGGGGSRGKKEVHLGNEVFSSFAEAAKAKGIYKDNANMRPVVEKFAKDEDLSFEVVEKSDDKDDKGSEGSEKK